MIELTFCGAAGTVTGSKYLLRAAGESLLVDYGMFQGTSELRKLNYEPPPRDPKKIDWLLLTHAHIDHSGLIPRLVRQGFDGQILCTPPTREVVELLLFDSAYLQSEDRNYHKKKGCIDCETVEPLYEKEDVEETLPKIQTQPYGKWRKLSDIFSFRFTNVGHILGSSMVEIVVKENGREVHILFSGDVGRYDMPLNPDPNSPPVVDYLVIESTYGDRRHPSADVFSQIEAIGRQTIEQKGILLVPAFAVGRAQQLILIFRELFVTGRLDKIPIHLDSPMAVDTTKIYCTYPEQLQADVSVVEGPRCILYGPFVHLHRSVDESKALNKVRGPAIVISSSGMLTGGRILHHLIQRLPHKENILMLAGYQAHGSLGRAIQDGAKVVRIHHQPVRVRARVADMRGLSAHADYEELLRWLSPVKQSPKTTFVTHGEPKASRAFSNHLKEKRWKTHIPARGETIRLI